MQPRKQMEPMTEEALRKPQGGQRHEGVPGVLYFAGFRYWTASVLAAIVGTTLLPAVLSASSLAAVFR